VHRRFVDEIKISVAAGVGAKGLIVAHRLANGRFVNNGGDGGKGGDVYARVDRNLTDLAKLKSVRKVKAPAGVIGGRLNKKGADGKNIYIKVPCGTRIKENGVVIADLTQEGAEVLLCWGGDGGKGNFKKRVNDYILRRSQPKKGERKELTFEFLIPADIALVGFTNTGKSFFLEQVSSLSGISSQYPFHTSVPVWAKVNVEYSSFVLVEIPAVGDVRYKKEMPNFLKHLARAKIIVLFQDDSCSSPDYFLLLKKKIIDFNPDFAKKRFIFVVNNKYNKVKACEGTTILNFARKQEAFAFAKQLKAILDEETRN